MSLLITNRCLNLMGAKSVANINDTEWSLVINSLVGSFYSLMLEEYNWLFATKFLELAKNTVNANPSYEFSYGLPSDFIRILTVYHADNSTPLPYTIEEWEYTIDTDNLYISAEPITISYTSSTTSIDNTAESFKLALSYRIIANVGASLTNNPTLVKYYQEMAIQTFNKAVNTDNSNKGKLDILTRARRYL